MLLISLFLFIIYVAVFLSVASHSETHGQNALDSARRGLFWPFLALRAIADFFCKLFALDMK